MRPLLRPVEMAAADRLTIEAGTPGHVLMDRAGRAVARKVIELAGGHYGRRVLVVCGKGNNGGDGFVVARVLRREGLHVTCAVVYDLTETGGDAAHHLSALRRAGIEPVPFDARIDVARFDVVVDAIFGTGFRGTAEGVPAEAIAALAGRDAVVAVDIPSGVDGTTGAVEGPVVRAAVTVAVAAEKTGTAVPPGSTYAGIVEVADIGIDVNVRKFEESGPGIRVSSFVEMAQAADVTSSLPVRRPDAHKRSAGSVAVLAGSDEMRGAAILTTQGALRMGAGYVTLGTTEAVKAAAAVRLPEALCRVVTDGSWLGHSAIESFARVVERADALAVGPGLGTDQEQGLLVAGLLEEAAIPMVLDADALNVLSRDVSPLRSAGRPVVLTPHPAELARLLGVATQDVVADRIEAAIEAAARFPGCVVLLKGHRTVISYAGGKAAVVIPVGGAELATAGSGDVLTGALAALLAQGVPPVGAAIAAGYVHGLAGSVAGQRVGELGVIAGDIAEALPEATELLLGVPVDA